MIRLLFSFALANVCLISFCQKPIVAGPMPGYVELRTAKIWLQFAHNVTEAAIYYKSLSSAPSKLLSEKMKLKGGEFNTAVFTLTALDPGTSYKYYISAGAGKKFLDSGKFVTQALWQNRMAPGDFTFLAGSCLYFNQREYDRPGKPYGGDSSIFIPMSKEKASFMLWLGDNWYTRYPDYSSVWGLHYRPSHERREPVLQPFLKAMSHYAIWDDHDYGPNDANKSYVLKEASADVFKKFWANPSYGMDGQGIYTMFTYNDADFFLLDDRWFRSSDKMNDSTQKKMFGDVQMEWLKNAILFSKSNPFTKFRVIVTGSQVLNQFSRFDAFHAFPYEYNQLMSFLQDNKINGVIFITGDRHHSEIVQKKRKDGYTLYDITVSPLTSSPAKTQGAEINNPDRVGNEIVKQNYGRFSFTGEGKERKLIVEILGIKGDILYNWSVKAVDLSY
ncbi:MAG TPA: alkaline phosphatase D family protein [Flavitalea sp.]|nr:alkaline phosphatase D family protein [Flavitalea sp.]